MPVLSTAFRTLCLASLVSGIGVAHAAQPTAAPPRLTPPVAPAPGQPAPAPGQPAPPANQPAAPPANQPAPAPAAPAPGQPVPPADQPDQPAPPADPPAAPPANQPAAPPVAQPAPAEQPRVPATITGTLRGRVIDTATGQPIAGAFVSAGDTTDLSGPDGRFTLTGIPLGTVEVMAVAELYTPQVLALDLTPALPVADVELTLAIDTKVMGEVVEIVGEAPDPAEPPSYDLGAAEIRVLPGSGNDTLKALQSLPGVARMPFGLGGLVLRGASPNDTNVYLDGVDVSLLYHFGGLASFYPSSMLTSLEMVPGNFSAEYGRSQGGVVLMRSRPGRTDRWRVETEVSLQDASVRGDGPAPFGGAWSVGLRRSYIDAVLGVVLPEDGAFALTLAPRYYDGQVRYDREIGPDQRISATLFLSDDRLSFLFEDEDENNPAEMTQSNFNFVQNFLRAALRWERRTQDITMSATPWIGINENAILFDDQGVSNEDIPYGLRLDLLRSFAGGYVAGGIDLQGARIDSFFNAEPPPTPGQEMPEDDTPVLSESSEWHLNAGFWLEGLYGFLDGRVNVKPGLRAEHYGLSEEWVTDPRLNVAIRLPHDVTLKPAVGSFHQPPNPRDLDPVTGNPDLESSYAVQTSLGVEWKPSAGIEISTTGFYNPAYDQPVDAMSGATGAGTPGSDLSGGGGAAVGETTTEAFGSYAYQENNGRGRNYGIEALIRATGGTPDRRGSWMGWISYTLSRSLRRYGLQSEMGGPEPYLPYVLDQPHVLTALATILVTDDWRVGARVQFVSGNPITPIVGAYYDAEAHEYRAVAGDLLSERLPAFFQLDLRIDRIWRRPWGTLSLFLDVRNVTNRANVEGTTFNHDYTQSAYTTGLPIFPSLGLEYRP